MSVRPTRRSSWPGLTRPPIRSASARRGDSSVPAGTGTMDGRLEAAHDGISCDFNDIKIYIAIVFLFQNSYLYKTDDLERPHAPHLSRRRGGTRACAQGRECETQKSGKNDEQFCCRRSVPRQSQGRRRAAGQPQRLALRQALQGLSRPSPARANPDRGHQRALRQACGHCPLGVSP
jgi:hypothetical protein